MNTIGLIALIFLIVLFVLIAIAPYTTLHSWQKFFDQVQFSGQDFYTRVEFELKARQLSDIKIEKEFASQTHIISDRRQYLCIYRKQYVMSICAAPFGTGMFASCHLAEKEERLLNKIPVLNTLLGQNRNRKTYYQADTEAMFRFIVQTVVVKVLNEMLEEKGLRKLPESEMHTSVLNDA